MKKLFVKALENIFEMEKEDAKVLAKTVEETNTHALYFMSCIEKNF